MRWFGVVLRLAVFSLLVFVTRPIVAKDGPARSALDVPWNAWAAQTKSTLGRPTAEELSIATGQVDAALQEIEKQLEDTPDGAILRRQLGLAGLARRFGRECRRLMPFARQQTCSSVLRRGACNPQSTTCGSALLHWAGR